MLSPVIFLLPLAVFSSSLVATVLSPELKQAIPEIVIDSGGPPFSLDPADHIQDPDVPGTAVRITVRLGTDLKQIDLALFDDETPETVANFRRYIDSGAFSSNIVHRTVPGFVLQGGGFRFTGPSTFDNVPPFAPVPNEPGISNVRGTVAMAKVGGDPDSATSQWFINLSDNSANLDSQNGGFTAFGRVIGGGMAVADEIADLPVYDVSGLHPAWTNVPLKNFADPLERAHFVETDMEIIPALTFSASSADPDLVSAEIIDGQLRLTPSTDRTGVTTVTITAANIEGAKLQAETPVTVMESYTSWGNKWDFPSAAEKEAAADSDGDGWSNLLEFAFGGDPLAAGLPPQRPKMEPGGGITFGRLEYARLNYIAWKSDDLETWMPVWSSPDGLDHSAVQSYTEEGGFQRVTIRVPGDAQNPSRTFWRVSVEAAE